MSLKPDPAADPPQLANERAVDAQLASDVMDRAFGPGRFTKVSERVREFAQFAPELSFCAWRDGRMVGVVRQWRVRAGETPIVFLGPIAVDEAERSSGLGGLLIERACAAAKAAGEAAIVLVGDEPYFGRFGFSAACARAVELPGPVDRNRVLGLAFSPEGERLTGMVRPL